MKWRDQAACLGMDVNIFYQDVKKGGDAQYKDARSICNSCPVRISCLEDALHNEIPSETFGMRGGLSAKQRIKLYRERKGLKPTMPAPKTDKCFRGHPTTKENRYMDEDNRWKCLLCARERSRLRRRKIRAEKKRNSYGRG